MIQIVEANKNIQNLLNNFPIMSSDEQCMAPLIADKIADNDDDYKTAPTMTADDCDSSNEIQISQDYDINIEDLSDFGVEDTTTTTTEDTVEANDKQSLQLDIEPVIELNVYEISTTGTLIYNNDNQTLEIDDITNLILNLEDTSLDSNRRFLIDAETKPDDNQSSALSSINENVFDSQKSTKSTISKSSQKSSSITDYDDNLNTTKPYRSSPQYGLFLQVLYLFFHKFHL